MGRRSKITQGVGKKKEEECLLNNLTDELLIEVFIRLPSSKEAIRCKSVCNRWFTLISSHYFRNTSLIHNRNYDKTLLPFTFVSIIEDEKSLYVIEFSTEKGLPRRVNLGFLYSGRPQDYRISLQGSYGDLILCSGSSDDYYIVNVMTKQWVVLFPPSPLEYYYYFLRISASVGFLIMDNAEYLVLRFISWGYSDVSKFTIQMFSSEQGMWTKLDVTSPRNLNILNYKTLIVASGRMLYTFTWKERAVVDCVLAFDPFTNDPDLFLRLIDFPQEARDIRSLACKLGVCAGRLRFAQLNFQPSGYPCISIWELEDDYRKGEWTLVQKRILTNTALRVPRLGGRGTIKFVSVIAFHPFNEDFIFFLVGNDLVVMYNMQTDKVESSTACPSLLSYNELQRSLPAVPITHSWWPTPVRPSLETQSSD